MSQPIECGKCGSFITEKGMTDCGVVKCEECGHEQEYHGVGCEGDHQVGKIPGDKPSGTAEKVADRLSGDLCLFSVCLYNLWVLVNFQVMKKFGEDSKIYMTAKTFTDKMVKVLPLPEPPPTNRN
ncbi:hypothetical protein AKJ38_00550 [candidate division MSBL1 archaeon SCGC-AAA259I14]|uniref:Uncharacterized protein n=1 Tax=candidate division MSBL1 archaeon SCGC-AAA259I14 TaxID=1698268 RepID=A0A133UTZ5_9EURY|nr:hypothetical protein AKJ38_00550 [candidate division MSBL1 archaeon SCGC-AAA259I14]